MPTKKIFTKVKDLPKTLDFMEYLVVIHKNGKFVKAVLYKGYSGHAMQDIIPDFYQKYPENKGYSVKW